MNIINTKSKCQNCKEFMDRLLKEQVERLKKEKQNLQDEFDILKEEHTLYKTAFYIVINDLKRDYGEGTRIDSDPKRLVSWDMYYLEEAQNLNKDNKNGN